MRTEDAALDHDRLVHAFYDAADSPAGMEDAIRVMSGHVGADRGQLLVLRGGVELVGNHAWFPMEDDAAVTAREYAEHWRDQDPRFAAAWAHPGRVISDVEVIPAAEFERSAIYNDFLVRSDSRYTRTRTSLCPSSASFKRWAFPTRSSRR